MADGMMLWCIQACGVEARDTVTREVILTTGRNIGNAKIQGLDKDLGLTSAQYSLCLTVFFFTYCGTYLFRSHLHTRLQTSG